MAKNKLVSNWSFYSIKNSSIVLQEKYKTRYTDEKNV